MDVLQLTKRSPSRLSRDKGKAVAATAVLIDILIETPPILRFEPTYDYEGLSFCVLDTRLYVIGADDEHPHPVHKNMWMSEIDLSLHMVSDSPPPPPTLMNAAALKRYRVPPMKADKCYPIAVPTPDGRILVFSKFIFTFSRFNSYNLSTEYADFEVYEPRHKRWQKLPQLHLMASYGEFFLIDNSEKWVPHPGGHLLKNWPEEDFIRIATGSFINGTSTFLLTLRVGLMFTLDLTSVEEGWKAYQDHPSLFLDVLSSYGFVEDEFLVVEPILETPRWVKDLKDGRKVPRPDVLPPGTCVEGERSPDVKILALKYVGGHECFTCTVTSGYVGDDRFPFLICSPYKHDIGGGGGAVSTPLSSFKYRITVKCYCIIIENVFLMEFESSPQTKHLKTG